MGGNILPEFLMNFPVYVLLFCHDNFDIVTYEKTALYDIGNSFKFLYI